MIIKMTEFATERFTRKIKTTFALWDFQSAEYANKYHSTVLGINGNRPT